MGTCSLNTKDILGVFNNQAALAYQNHFELGLAYENRYLLKESGRVSLCAALKAGRGALFAGIDHFGSELYSEMKAGAGYALKLGSHFAAGLQLDYLRVAIGEGYGNYHAFTMEGGIMFSPGEKISLGVYCFNPVGVGWMGIREKLPLVFRAGGSFRPEQSISIHAEIHKSNLAAANFSAGIEYCLREHFYFRAGISSGMSSISFGVGYRTNRLSVNISSSWHAYLGFSPQFSFTYSSIK